MAALTGSWSSLPSAIEERVREDHAGRGDEAEQTEPRIHSHAATALTDPLLQGLRTQPRARDRVKPSGGGADLMGSQRTWDDPTVGLSIDASGQARPTPAIRASGLTRIGSSARPNEGRWADTSPERSDDQLFRDDPTSAPTLSAGATAASS